MHTVLIVGAGIIGLMCAHELRRAGYDVVVVDRYLPGAGCSQSNTGWITLSLARPLPGPDVVLSSLAWTLKRDAPLFIQPRALPRLAGWLWKFTRYCNQYDYRRGVEAIRLLASQAMVAYDSLRADGITFEMHSSGLLFAFLSQHALQNKLAELNELQVLRPLGFPPPRVLGPSEVRDLEPHLMPEVTGAILVEGERHIRPESLNTALVERLQGSGVRIVSGFEVKDFKIVSGRVQAVMSEAEEISADCFVLAAGISTSIVAHKLACRLPLQSGKGYSITYPEAEVQFAHAVYFDEARIACSQYDRGFRLAGTMELSNHDPRLEMPRLIALARSARRYVTGWRTRGAVTWAGLRPMTPDGLPIIGRLRRYENVCMATGHGMLGVTLAPGTAIAVRKILSSGSEDLDAFSPSRFDCI